MKLKSTRLGRAEVEDEEVRDEPPEMHMSDDEEIEPAGPYEQDSDSEDEDGHPAPPPAKRARELDACSVPGAIHLI